MIEYVDEHYLRRLFTRSSEKNSLTRLFEKLALTEHYANMYAATGHTGITPIPSSARIEPVAETDAETDAAAAAAAAVAAAATVRSFMAAAQLARTKTWSAVYIAMSVSCFASAQRRYEARGVSNPHLVSSSFVESRRL